MGAPRQEVLEPNAKPHFVKLEAYTMNTQTSCKPAKWVPKLLYYNHILLQGRHALLVVGVPEISDLAALANMQRAAKKCDRPAKQSPNKALSGHKL
ncbi:MAG: hypothetical protein FRX49_06875 [Trebouxia sp. A1-2]|nr:MAG: hypothetical protein FRX49_06875 [Trebouxia sp. A1-2]